MPCILNISSSCSSEKTKLLDLFLSSLGLSSPFAAPSLRIAPLRTCGERQAAGPCSGVAPWRSSSLQTSGLFCLSAHISAVAPSRSVASALACASRSARNGSRGTGPEMRLPSAVPRTASIRGVSHHEFVQSGTKPQFRRLLAVSLAAASPSLPPSRFPAHKCNNELLSQSRCATTLCTSAPAISSDARATPSSVTSCAAAASATTSSSVSKITGSSHRHHAPTKRAALD
mmetsp:Transcript_106467/g.188532  ORF Transcript_106467/g.188532 Transcript_106467/m.188532 type:complete len:230 (+) Transcript_106467:231-920(+)